MRNNSLRALRVGIVLAAMMLLPAGLAVAQAPAARGSSPLGICEREGIAVVGIKPIRVGKAVRAPKKLRDVRPKYPEVAQATRGTGNWMGEVLLDTHGKVAHLWTVREIRFMPPFPEFNKAIVDAIRQWEFEPLLVKSAPTPVCMTVTVTVDWQ
jgi:hypothetical protein